jgi:WhiB family redox-sensing transcriptional regulator
MTPPKPATRKTAVEPPIKNLPHGGTANLTWLHDAACTDADPTLFFPETIGDHSSYVRDITAQYCDHCPVKQQCHQYAVDINATAGIFGGEEFLSAGARYARRHRAKYHA